MYSAKIKIIIILKSRDMYAVCMAWHVGWGFAYTQSINPFHPSGFESFLCLFWKRFFWSLVPHIEFRIIYCSNDLDLKNKIVKIFYECEKHDSLCRSRNQFIMNNVCTKDHYIKLLVKTVMMTKVQKLYEFTQETPKNSWS